MIIAIHKQNPERWVQLFAKPSATDIMHKNWYVFDMPDIANLKIAVRVAKIKRAVKIANL